MRSLAVSLLACLLAAPAAARPPRGGGPPELKTLHILMVFDTRDAKLAPGLRIDQRRLTALWEAAIPKGRYTLTALSGDQATAAAILGHYRKLKLGPAEGALFYYGGHGAAERGSGPALLLKAGRPLPRAELRQAMEATQAGLVVILTDSCSAPVRLATTTRQAAAPRPAEALHPTARGLLFQARGTVDVTAATNNAAWGDSERGGLFTRAFAAALQAPASTYDADKDGLVTWHRFFPRLQKQAEALFDGWLKDMRGHGASVGGRHQRPQALSLGRRVSAIARSYAVLNLENVTGSDMKYRFRWAGQTAWQPATLKKDEKRAHFLLLPGDGGPPDLEAQFAGVTGTQRLRSRKWSGHTEPDAQDARPTEYRLRPR